MDRTTQLVANTPPCGQTRRQFLWELGGGFASLPLIDLLSRDGVFGEANAATNGSTKGPHFAAKAKQVVFFFLNGGPSHIDTFDPKPALTKHSGQKFHGNLQIGSNGRAIGHLTPSHFPYRRHGESGLPITSLFPNVAKFADDLCVIRSMYANTPTHSPGILQMNTGSIVFGKPSLGAWLGYGLGSLNDNLPNYVVMTDPRGGPRGGAGAWTSGFMPAAYQGTLFRSQGSPVLNLKTPSGLDQQAQRRTLDLLGKLNKKHLAKHKNESELAGRIEAYELAY